MPHPVTTGQQDIARLKLRNDMGRDGRVTFGAQAAHQDVGVGMVVGLGFRQLTPVDQRLHIGVVAGAKRQPGTLKVINARVARMDPVAVTPGVDQKRRDGAVGFLLCRDGGQPNDDVRLFDHVLEHCHRVVGVGRIALEQLARRHHDLVRRLAPAAAATHPVGDHTQHAAVVPLMGDQCHLVLLVFAVTLVDAGGGDEAKRFGHAADCGGAYANACRGKRAKRVLSARLWHFCHARGPLP